MHFGRFAMRKLLVLKKHALDLSKFVNVELYCNASCQDCKRTRTLFEEKGIRFTEHRIDKDKDLKETMIKRCSKNSIPQIFINKNHIGGYDDLVRLNNSNELDVLLGLARANSESDMDESSQRKTIVVGE
jgi:glutaredoxin 3